MGTLNWIFIAMSHLVFLQATLGHKTFATFLADERTIARMNGPNMCLHIDQFTETLVAKLTRMHVLLVVRQVNRFVDVELL